MIYKTIALGLLASSASAFSPSFSALVVSSSSYSSSAPTTQLNAVNNNNNDNNNNNSGNDNDNDNDNIKRSMGISRRSMFASLSTSTLATASLFLATTPPAANASLLDDFGTDPSKIQQKAAEPAIPTPTSKKKDESGIEPNLRSNYYYPTNKKRYLPRIKRCNDAIPSVADAIGNLDWEAVTDFNVKIADDTILPMRLYTSSLLGGGTNVKVSFTKDMNTAADTFEKGQKALTKAIKKQDQSAASRALEDMATALLSYRTAGRLLGPDGGGDIPSVDEIRRSACRVQGRSFEQKIKARDARLVEASSEARPVEASQ